MKTEFPTEWVIVPPGEQDDPAPVQDGTAPETPPTARAAEAPASLARAEALFGRNEEKDRRPAKVSRSHAA